MVDAETLVVCACIRCQLENGFEVVRPQVLVAY